MNEQNSLQGHQTAMEVVNILGNSSPHLLVVHPSLQIHAKFVLRYGSASALVRHNLNKRIVKN